MPKAVALLALIAVAWCNAAAQVRHRPHHKVMIMKATAFTRARHATSAGTTARQGTVAADPSVLPLGTRIRIAGADAYDGSYLVTDTGAAVKGRHIDLYLPSEADAKKFGTRTVRVVIRSIGTGKADAREKDLAGVRRGPR